MKRTPSDHEDLWARIFRELDDKGCQMLRVSKVAAHVSAADCKTDMEREECRNDLVDDLAKKGAKMHAVPLQAIAAVKNRKRLTEDIQRMQVAILKLHDASRKKIGREQLNARVENIIDELKLRAQYQHVKLSDRWKQRKITLLGHILRAPADDPMEQILFEQGTDGPRIEHTRGVGKLRANWFVESCRDAYTNVIPTPNLMSKASHKSGFW